MSQFRGYDSSVLNSIFYHVGLLVWGALERLVLEGFLKPF